ncbi:MFS-type transporter involved in bile tolerance (Atg22 family) [Litoreibacter ponti]|uniref:MFS-type transporter involved in bile tolerance (Atg22 family) n=1 Tax=Litoreibacter ponti TaxID=1510457 RepID=A0A2T6BNP1_9RHOB|nr:MFS transporter [Litoreibacter ponti]PTX57703.1 MFS-type transporter involved in bile tolerance (Atg22 family) [Litoreibacter ponti]
MSLIAVNRNFRLLFSATAVSNLGDGISALAFPWLASLITRDPFLIAAVAAATRAPWLVFSLPAGVITDQVDRKRLMVSADVLRMILTLGVVGLILSAPPLPFDDNASAALPMILGLCAAAFLLGSAEVVRDNAAQTALPSIVETHDLERANGQLWSIEQIMGQFVGPPVAGVLIALAVPVPFLVDAATFGIAAFLVWQVAMMPKAIPAITTSFWARLKEGADWMRGHALILRLALMLGVLNFVTMMSATMLVLLAQEQMGLEATGYGFLLTAGAAGGVAGGLIGPKLAARFGAQACVLGALACFPIPFIILALTSNPWLAGLALFLEMSAGMTWNVVTVSLRQRVIPDALLGRVNSIYRFFGWGSIPLGALFAGALVAALEEPIGRDLALRAPYTLGAIVCVALLLYGTLRLRLPQS